MARGGYQKPRKPSGPSGPGKFSKRTDGQAKRVEGLDSPDMNYGDRQMLEAGQAAAPVRGAAGAEVRRLSGQPTSTRRLPAFLFNRESANPLEPATAGMSRGPGPGPEVLDAATPPDDEREVVLNFLATEYQNPTAKRHLAELRAEKAQAAAPAASALRVSAPTVPSEPELQPTGPTLG